MKQDTGSEPKASVRMIAERLGVSPATVSLALNGRKPSGSVSVSTRQQVWNMAKEVGYPLSQLRSKRPLLERVAVFLNNVTNPVYSETLLHLCRAFSLNGVQVLMYLTRTDREAYKIAQDLSRRSEVDGAVFVGSRSEMPTLDIFCVFVGEVPPDSNVWQVRADNEGGGRAVGEYLWSLGHRSVAMIAPLLANSAGDKRLQGLRTFLAEQGESLPDNRILRGNFDKASDVEVRSMVSDFLQTNRQSSNPATALFCFNDWIAGVVLKILRGMNVRVPEDISVVGFDDGIYAELLDVPLTTVHHPFDTLGTQAAELLLEQVESPDASPRVLITRCRLVGRQSCSPVAPAKTAK